MIYSVSTNSARGAVWLEHSLHKQQLILNDDGELIKLIIVEIVEKYQTAE